MAIIIVSSFICPRFFMFFGHNIVVDSHFKISNVPLIDFISISSFCHVECEMLVQ